MHHEFRYIDEHIPPERRFVPLEERVRALREATLSADTPEHWAAIRQQCDDLDGACRLLHLELSNTLRSDPKLFHEVVTCIAGFEAALDEVLRQEGCRDRTRKDIERYRDNAKKRREAIATMGERMQRVDAVLMGDAALRRSRLKLFMPED